MKASFPGSSACGQKRETEECAYLFRFALSGCLRSYQPMGRTILTWPSGLHELSFSNCDNRKNLSRAHGRKTPTAPAARRSSFLVAHSAGSDCCGFPAGRLGGHEGAFCVSSRVSNPLKTDWRRHVLAWSGYLELEMFDDAALVLEEIAPEDKNRNEPFTRWLATAAAISRNRRLVDQPRLCAKDRFQPCLLDPKEA